MTQLHNSANDSNSQHNSAIDEQDFLSSTYLDVADFVFTHTLHIPIPIYSALTELLLPSTSWHSVQRRPTVWDRQPNLEAAPIGRSSTVLLSSTGTLTQG